MADDAKENIEFDVMPGADTLDNEADGNLDMNFGLGEEPVVAEEEEIEDEEVQTEPAAEEPVAEEEEEDEVVAEEEPLLEEEEEEPVEQKRRKPMVPKSRLDEVLAKQKALQKQLDDLLAAKGPEAEAPQEYDFTAKEVEYQNLLLDGETTKAAQLRQEIRQAERAQLEFEMSQKMQENMTQNQQMSALQQAAAELENNFPVFDRNSPDFNEEYTQEVIDLRDAFITKGENAVAALTKAAKYVLREYDLVDNTPSLAEKPKRAVDEVAKKRAEVAKKLKAAESQPPEMAGEGSTSRGERPFDVNSLSEDEFNALPEATLRRLRGDVF
jgi:hypothetical protein